MRFAAIMLFLAFTTGSFAQSDSTGGLPKEHSMEVKNIAMPVAFISYGMLRNVIKPINTLDISTRNELRENGSTFQSSLDGYTQWAPTAALALMNAGGMRTRHTIKDQIILHAVSTVIMSGTVYTLKQVTGRYRPDSSEATSFPSGHTATAFVGAEMMHQELKNTHPVLSYTGYLVATATGIYRLYNNKHWLSDVVAGAGFGMLSTRFSYWLFNKVQSRKMQKKGPVF